MNENDIDTSDVGFTLSPATYNKARFLVQIVLPAFATFYLTIGDTLDLPATDKVAAVTVALTTFLGVVLGLSRKNFNASDAKYDGALTLHERPDGGQTYSLDLKGDPEELAGMKTVTFKVDPTVVPLPPPAD